MNIFRLSVANLKFRALGSSFNILILAIGIATIITLLHLGQQLEQRFSRDLQGIDLVVGAKGSPLQLILSSVFHLDIPNGNIPLEEAKQLEANPLIKTAIPLALGDNYRGFRIVGTTPDYAKHYNGQLAEGNYWTKEMQVVLGSEVAGSSGLRLGQSFVGSHGLVSGGEEHADLPYLVVGLLKPTGTVLDRLALTTVASVWHIHEHQHHDIDGEDTEEAHHLADVGELSDKPADHDEKDHAADRELTALLISYRTPLAAVSLPRLVNKTSSMHAASPAFEMARLFKILGVGTDMISMFGTLLMGIAALGFFITLFNAINDRRYDIALMRSLGATRNKIFTFVVCEGLILGMCGTLVGILLGHALAYGAQRWIEVSRHLNLNPVLFHPYELYVVAAAVTLSLLAALIPALLTYRINPAAVLAKGL